MEAFKANIEPHIKCPRRLECDLSEMRLLFSISTELNQRRPISHTLQIILELLARHRNIARGMLVILDRESSVIRVESAFGLNNSERERGQYRIGEGIIGQVIQSREPFFVPRIADEPRFLDKTKSRTEEDKSRLSFLCVPIFAGDEVAGAIAVDMYLEDPEPDSQNEIRTLSVVGSLVARAIRAQQRELEERQRLLEQNQRLSSELKQRVKTDQMLGTSATMNEVAKLITQVASTNTTILIRGESGVGKELVASAIHYNSARANGPFIRVNIGALPEDLVESELFGYEPGAFTSANKVKQGRFELADGGTLFLDEMGEISMSTQVKILRVLQEREFERLGGTKTIKCNVRVITATNRDLEHMVEEGSFRQDLFYRINVFPIFVPPLRDRQSDIPILADHFMTKFMKENAKLMQGITPNAMKQLMAYHWPGNVRELQNCIERACILSNDTQIHAYHLPPSLQQVQGEPYCKAIGLQEQLDHMEKTMIMDALQEHQGNMAKAAITLNISERIIGLRVKKYDIDPKDYKDSQESE